MSLHRRGVPFETLVLETFVRGIWPQAQQDPNPDRWAGEFTAWRQQGQGAG